MQITFISDTHNQHEALGTLSGDVLVHCGDLFELSTYGDAAMDRLDAWFARQRFDRIFVIGGNHDRLLERRLTETAQPFRHATVLHDQQAEHDGVWFYGSPWTPQLYGHAFFADDPQQIDAFSQIPAATDVLITHTPPAGILDVSSRGRALGCPHLLRAVRRVRPRIHAFGRVHFSAGVEEGGETMFVKACSVSSRLEVICSPVVFELSVDDGEVRRVAVGG